MFENYICKTTGQACCGCSFYCEHRSLTIEGDINMEENIHDRKYCVQVDGTKVAEHMTLSYAVMFVKAIIAEYYSKTNLPITIQPEE